jgi:hypothetical protein
LSARRAMLERFAADRVVTFLDCFFNLLIIFSFRSLALGSCCARLNVTVLSVS